MRLLRGKKGKAIRIAILDGVVWIKDSTKMYRTVCELEETALTSLSLKDFLVYIRKMILEKKRKKIAERMDALRAKTKGKNINLAQVVKEWRKKH